MLKHVASLSENSSPTAYTESSLDTLLHIRKYSFNLEDFNFIPTIKYRHHIESTCYSLNADCGFNKYALALVYNKQKIWLSNTYSDLAIPYHTYQLYRIDTSILEENYHNKDHFFPAFDLNRPIDQLYRKIIGEIFNFHNIYILVRGSFDCFIIIVAGADHPIGTLAEAESIYKKSFHQLELFTIRFLDEYIDLLGVHYPYIKYSRLFYDKSYRKNMILGKIKENVEPLTTQEIACLHWASFGKTADETALIISISPHTVRQHLKNAIMKLDAKNITHAVFKAKSIELI